MKGEAARIVLIRHGRPAARPCAMTTGAASMAAWIAAHDGAGIDSASPRTDTRDAVRDAATILCSPMPRAVASARRIAGDRAVVILPDAFEAPLSVGAGARLRLPPALWLALLRVGWFCGWSDTAERPADTRRRATRVATELMERAGKEGTIPFVGHGIFNLFVARVLRHAEWSGPRVPRGGYWRCSVYDAPGPQDTRVSA